MIHGWGYTPLPSEVEPWQDKVYEWYHGYPRPPPGVSEEKHKHVMMMERHEDLILRYGRDAWKYVPKSERDFFTTHYFQYERNVKWKTHGAWPPDDEYTAHGHTWTSKYYEPREYYEDDESEDEETKQKPHFFRL